MAPSGVLLMTTRAMTAAEIAEQWKPVVGFEGLYEVSDFGRVRSRHRSGECILRQQPVPSGHKVVDLRNRGIRAMSKIHRLVLEAFVGPAPAGTEGCHCDGDPSNNALANLRWDTRAGNEADKRRHGTDNAGSRHGNARLSEEDVLRIREARLFGAMQRDLANAYGTSRSWISVIAARKVWRHI